MNGGFLSPSMANQDLGQADSMPRKRTVMLRHETSNLLLGGLASKATVSKHGCHDRIDEHTQELKIKGTNSASSSSPSPEGMIGPTKARIGQDR